MDTEQKNLLKTAVMWAFALTICLLPPIRNLGWAAGFPVGFTIGLGVLLILKTWMD